MHKKKGMAEKNDPEVRNVSAMGSTGLTFIGIHSMKFSKLKQ